MPGSSPRWRSSSRPRRGGFSRRLRTARSCCGRPWGERPSAPCAGSCRHGRPTAPTWRRTSPRYPDQARAAMNARLAPLLLAVVLPALLATGGQSPPSTAPPGHPHKHEHHPPHGGTPVVLGDEAYHIELVLDASAGTLQAFVLDGELENFIRSAAPSFE